MRLLRSTLVQYGWFLLRNKLGHGHQEGMNWGGNKEKVTIFYAQIDYYANYFYPHLHLIASVSVRCLKTPNPCCLNHPG